jgi:hypothetical protein
MPISGVTSSTACHAAVQRRQETNSEGGGEGVLKKALVFCVVSIPWRGVESAGSSTMAHNSLNIYENLRHPFSGAVLTKLFNALKKSLT